MEEEPVQGILQNGPDDVTQAEAQESRNDRGEGNVCFEEETNRGHRVSCEGRKGVVSKRKLEEGPNEEITGDGKPE